MHGTCHLQPKAARVGRAQGRMWGVVVVVGMAEHVVGAAVVVAAAAAAAATVRH